MNKFWYDHIKEKNDKKAKLCYIHTENFIYTKTDDLIWKKGLIHTFSNGKKPNFFWYDEKWTGWTNNEGNFLSKTKNVFQQKLLPWKEKKAKGPQKCHRMLN